MSQVLCVHCQQPVEDGAPRRGNLVTCTHCKGQVFVPQVQHVSTFEEKQAAARATASARQKSGPRNYKSSGSRGAAVNSNGFSVTLIVLAILVFGGAGLGVVGYFVYKAVKGHMDARVQMATSVYDFEKQARPTPPPSPLPQSNASASASATGTSPGLAALESFSSRGSPTRQDLEKLQKFFRGLDEASDRMKKDYMKDLERTGISQLLTAGRISADKDFSQSRKIITAAREVIARHRQIAEVEDEAFLQDLSKLKLEGVPTEVMVGRLRALIQQNQPAMDKYRSMDTAIAAQYEQAINHLEETRGTWKLEGESVVFNENKHAERYKTFFDEVDKCAQTKVDLWYKIGQESAPKLKAAFGLMN